MKLSGHLTPSVFRRYDIVSSEDLKDAARKLDAGERRRRRDVPRRWQDTMTASDCVNIFNHEGCHHDGWREHRLASGDMQVLNAARLGANYAQQDLGLDMIRIRFFEPGPVFSWNLNDPDHDQELVALNAGVFDPAMMGKAVHPQITPLPTIWVRAGLSPATTTAIALHEARHIWQMHNDMPGSSEALEERDAEVYMWPALLKMGFERQDIVRAMRECNFGKVP